MIYSVFNHRKGDRFLTDYSLLGAKETIQSQLLCIVNAIFPIGVFFIMIRFPFLFAHNSLEFVSNIMFVDYVSSARSVVEKKPVAVFMYMEHVMQGVCLCCVRLCSHTVSLFKFFRDFLCLFQK
jgi:hypothetical protein